MASPLLQFWFSLVSLTLLAGCGQAEQNTAERPKVFDLKDQLLGKWNCTTRTENYATQDQISFATDYSYVSKGRMEMTSAGMETVIKIESRGVWSLDGYNLQMEPRDTRVMDVEAKGGLSAYIKVERELEKQLRQAFQKPDHQTAEISTITKLDEKTLQLTRVQEHAYTSSGPKTSSGTRLALVSSAPTIRNCRR